MEYHKLIQTIKNNYFPSSIYQQATRYNSFNSKKLDSLLYLSTVILVYNFHAVSTTEVMLSYSSLVLSYDWWNTGISWI